MKSKYFYLVYVIFVILLLIFIFQKNTKAELVYFYPQSCLGNFINPEKAQGEPEVRSPDLINETNSAVYLGGFKEIYCGNFQGPIEDGEINNIILKFNMVLTNERKETPIIETSPKTIEIINTSTENSTNTVPENLSTSTIEIPQSFFYKIVFAEEITNSEPAYPNENLTSEQTFVTSTTEETINTIIQETNTITPEATKAEELTTQETNTTTQETTTTQLEQTFNYFDIFYTLDGQTWEYLGSITNKNSQDIIFSIPVNDWLMIPKIQIKVQSNPNLNNIPYLYLESMSLEVEFTKEKATEETIATSTEISTPTPALLKERIINREIKIKNSERISCKIEPFSIYLNENEVRQVKILLNSKNTKKLEIGNLPPGIDIIFASNKDYQIQTDSNELILNISREINSVKGNFNLPIIFNSDDATVICQINVITTK